jgi:hypothetical protein
MTAALGVVAGAVQPAASIMTTITHRIEASV